MTIIKQTGVFSFPVGPAFVARPGKAMYCLMLELILCLWASLGLTAEILTVAKPFGPAGIDFDPAKGSNGWYASEAGITETLFALDGDMKLVSWLATDYVNLSPVSWKIRLRDSVLFHSQTPMSAEAVKASFTHLIDESSPGFNRRIQGLLDLKEIRVQDSQTLIFETRRPNAGFLYALTSPEAGIVDMAERSRHYPAGTGPFQLNKMVSNQKMEVTAFKNYWGGSPKLSRADLFVIKNPVSRMLAFESGKIDIAVNFPELDALRLIQTDPKNQHRIRYQPTARLCFFFVRVKEGPLSDPLVRKALNLAIDRNQILNSVLGGIGGVAGASIFPAVLPWCNTHLSPYAHDPEKATSLLESAGIKDIDGDGIREKDGGPLRLEMWTYETRASLKPTLELIKSQLARIGIDTGIRVTKKGSPINQAMTRGRVHLNLQMWNTAPQGDPHAFLSDVFMTGARSNFMGYANPELDKLIREAITCFDPVRRARLYNRAQQIIYNQSPVIVLFHKSMVTAISDRVHGYKIHPAEKYLMSQNISLIPQQ